MGKKKNLEKNALSKQLITVTDDMHKVEMELDVHLTELARKVDDGFKQLRGLNRTGMTLARQLASKGHPKYGMAATGLAFAISGIAGIYSGVKAANAHNRALDRLLEQKKKIARENMKSLLTIEEIADRNEATLKALFKKEITQQYDTTDLLYIKKSRNGIKANILQIANLYKISLYNKYMVDYILAEYRAWNSGCQRSKLKRPIMSMVNTDIYRMLTSDGDWDYIKNLLYGYKQKFTGGDICFLSDQSLTAVMFEEKCFVHKSYVKHISAPTRKIAEKLMKPNICFRLCRRTERLLWFFGGWPAITSIVVLSIALFGLLDVNCYHWWAEWNVILKWVVLVVLGVIEVAALCLAIFLYEDVEDNLMDNIWEKGRMKQLKIMGYVEVFEPDLDKKSLIWAGTKGFISGLLST